MALRLWSFLYCFCLFRPEAVSRSVYGYRYIRPFTSNSTLGEIQTCEMGRQVVAQMKQGLAGMFEEGSDLGVMFAAMLQDMPLRQLAMMGVLFHSPHSSSSATGSVKMNSVPTPSVLMTLIFSL